MTAFQRLSTGPTLPDLIRKAADRRAQRSLHMLPTDVWLRPAIAATFWHHRNNGWLEGDHAPGAKPGGTRRSGEAGHIRERAAHAAPRPGPAKIEDRATTQSSRAAQADLAAHTLRSWQCQAGMAACFTGANGILATTRLLNWCRLLSPDGIGTALAGADRLTRAGMRFWRTSQLRIRP